MEQTLEALEVAVEEWKRALVEVASGGEDYVPVPVGESKDVACLEGDEV